MTDRKLLAKPLVPPPSLQPPPRSIYTASPRYTLAAVNLSPKKKKSNMHKNKYVPQRASTYPLPQLSNTKDHDKSRGGDGGLQVRAKKKNQIARTEPMSTTPGAGPCPPSTPLKNVNSAWSASVLAAAAAAAAAAR